MNSIHIYQRRGSYHRRIMKLAISFITFLNKKLLATKLWVTTKLTFFPNYLQSAQRY